MSKKKTLLSAILAIVFCMSLIAGSTFALFTSESRVNIAVTSGKVSVTAEIENLQLFSATETDTGIIAGEVTEGLGAGTYYYEALSGNMFTNLGTAELSGNTLTLSRITPGDKVTFDIVVTNYSNVSIKYRTLIANSNDADADFFNQLEFDIDGSDTVGATAWTYVTGTADTAGTVIKTLECSVLLPITVGNDYQDKTCTIVFTVEAIQGNAVTSAVDTSAPITLAGNAEDLMAALNGLKDNGTVILTQDIDLDGENWNVRTPWSASSTTITIDGGGHTIYNMKTGGTDGETYGGLLGRLTTNGNVVIKDLNFENVTLTGNGSDGECAGGALVGWYENHGGSISIENVHVKNITTANFKYAGGIIGYVSADKTLVMENCSVDGSEIGGINHSGGLIGYLSLSGSSGISATVENCIVKNIDVKDTNSNKNREGAVVGTLQAGCSVSNVTLTNVKVKSVLVTEATQAVGAVNNGTVSNITIN